MREQRRAARLNSTPITTPSFLLFEPLTLLQAPTAAGCRRSDCGASVPHRPAMQIPSLAGHFLMPAIARALDHKKIRHRLRRDCVR
jgi:hypothetical protein